MGFGNVFVAIFLGIGRLYTEVFFCQSLFFSYGFWCPKHTNTFDHACVGRCSRIMILKYWWNTLKLTRLMVGNAAKTNDIFKVIFLFVVRTLTPFGCNSPLSFVRPCLRYMTLISLQWMKTGEKYLHDIAKREWRQKNPCNTKNEHIKRLVICDPYLGNSVLFPWKHWPSRWFNVQQKFNIIDGRIRSSCRHLFSLFFSKGNLNLIGFLHRFIVVLVYLFVVSCYPKIIISITALQSRFWNLCAFLIPRIKSIEKPEEFVINLK